MGNRCKICTSPNRLEIDRILVSGSASFRAIANRFAVSRASLQRHAAAHLPVALVEAQVVHEESRANDLLDELESLQDKVLEVLAKAELSGDLRGALQGLGQARENVKLMAQLTGQLSGPGAVVQVANVSTSPEWAKLRGLILDALLPFPDALVALQVALEAEGQVDVQSMTDAQLDALIAQPQPQPQVSYRELPIGATTA